MCQCKNQEDLLFASNCTPKYIFLKDSVKARCRTEENDIKNAALIFSYKDNHQINKVMMATENTKSQGLRYFHICD